MKENLKDLLKIAERFIRTFINTWLQFQKMSFDKLDDIVYKCNNTFHSTIKIKPVDVESDTYSDSSKEINDQDPKFKTGDIVRIWKYKNILAKGYTPNCMEDVFVIRKVKNTMLWTYVINDLNWEEIVGTVKSKNYKKQIKNNLELKM